MHGRVYTVVVQNTNTKTLMMKTANKIRPDSVLYTDSYHGYYARNVSDFHHFGLIILMFCRYKELHQRYRKFLESSQTCIAIIQWNR